MGTVFVEENVINDVLSKIRRGALEEAKAIALDAGLAMGTRTGETGERHLVAT